MCWLLPVCLPASFLDCLTDCLPICLGIILSVHLLGCASVCVLVALLLRGSFAELLLRCIGCLSRRTPLARPNVGLRLLVPSCLFVRFVLRGCLLVCFCARSIACGHACCGPCLSSFCARSNLGAFFSALDGLLSLPARRVFLVCVFVCLSVGLIVCLLAFAGGRLDVFSALVGFAASVARH